MADKVYVKAGSNETGKTSNTIHQNEIDPKYFKVCFTTILINYNGIIINFLIFINYN